MLIIGVIVTPIMIQHASSPQIDAYTSIRERDLTRGHGARFIVEGKVALEALLTRSQYKVESLFLKSNRLEPLAGLLAHVPDEVPVYVANQDVMDSVAGFPMHRGVLACGIKGDQKSPADILGKLDDGPQTILLLAGLSNHDNVGACFRNASAFGASAILLDDQSCDPLYRKSIRVSSGTVLSLPFSHSGSGIGMIKAAKSAGFDVWAMTPRASATPLFDASKPQRLAILLGSEGPGLADELIASTQAIRIPMVDGFDSINVATAGAVTLAHLFVN